MNLETLEWLLKVTNNTKFLLMVCINHNLFLPITVFEILAIVYELKAHVTVTASDLEQSSISNRQLKWYPITLHFLQKC